MTDKTYTIKTMTRADLDIAVEWAAQEGWNPGLQDAGCYYNADPNGFLMGMLGDEPIASISVVKYGESFGFLGFYIVKADYRGQGYGIQIWNAGMDYLAGRNVGLDGVVAQQENYRKSGFKLAYGNMRYEGIGGGTMPDDPSIVVLSTLPVEKVTAYDAAFFPEDRANFIESWISQPGTHALGILKAGELAGYGVIRPCRTGYKIGPLFADDADKAEALFGALKSKVGANDAIFLDVPAVNPDAVALAERHDMAMSFETARMYTGEIPEISVDRTYGVTSFEIG